MGWLLLRIRFRLRSQRSYLCRWRPDRLWRHRGRLSLRLSLRCHLLIRRYRLISCLYQGSKSSIIRRCRWRLIHRHRRRQKLICRLRRTIRRWPWRNLRSLIRVSQLRILISHRWRRKEGRIILLSVIRLRS
jgi:hypothetical protein